MFKGVQFEDEATGQSTNDRFVIKRNTGLIYHLVRLGLVRSEKQGEIVLIIIALLMCALAVYVFANYQSGFGLRPVDTLPAGSGPHIDQLGNPI
jgi:hypothetical protein